MKKLKKDIYCIIVFHIFIWSLTFSFGQRIRFYGEDVDSIFIRSIVSAYQFDKKGSTLGKASTLILYFDKKHNDYQIETYNSEKFKGTFRPYTYNSKKRDLLRTKFNKIESIKLNELLVALSTDINPDSLIYQIDTVKFLQHVSKKQIMNQAKLFNINWHFRRKYTTKEQKNALFYDCQSIDTFKTYLKNRFNKGYTVVTDVSNTFDIWITTSNQEYHFEGKYPHPFKQPWFLHDTSYSETPVLNLNINKILVQLLSLHFVSLDSIEEETLFNDYIRWYFVQRNMY